MNMIVINEDHANVLKDKSLDYVCRTDNGIICDHMYNLDVFPQRSVFLV